MTVRGDRTRDALVDAAEQLWAERGIESVSVREINARAGQRNNNALHYHFGGRAALFAAIAERHLTALNERSEKLWAEVRAVPTVSLRDQVSVLVRPAAEYIGDGSSARAWLRIAARLLGAPEQTNEQTRNVVSNAVIEVGTALVERVAIDLGWNAAVDRVRMTSDAVMHVIGDRARLEDARDSARPRMPLAVFVELVIDMTTTAMTSPPSDPLLRVLASVRQSP